MYLSRPLALASGCLKSLLFAAMSSDNLPSAITLASVDVGIRGAHLATYVGLSRAGLQLPAGLFLPPPTPITDTELALYVTPVAAAVWSPSVDAIDALVRSWTAAASNIITIDTAGFRRTVENVTRSYGRYTQPLRHAPPLLGLMTLQDDYSYTHNYSQSAIQHTPPHSPFDSPILLPINSPSGWPIHPTSSFADPFQSQPSLSATGTTSAPPLSPTLAAVVLGQCTPYRVLRSLGDTVLKIDLGGDPSPAMIDYKHILDELILDELEEPKEKTKMFVEYRPPSCTEDSCALVVYVEPSSVIYNYSLDCWVLLLCCHICITTFYIVRACSMVYRVVRQILRVLYSMLVRGLGLIRSMLEGLVRIILVICAWGFMPSPAGAQGSAPSVESPSLPISLQLPVPAVPATSNNPNPVATPSPAPDAPHQQTHSNSGLKKKNEKRHKKKKGTKTRKGDVFDQANIAPPRDNGECCVVPDSKPVVQSAAVAPPLVPTLDARDCPSTINPANILAPQDNKTTPTLLSPTPLIDASSPTAIVDSTSAPPPEEDHGGGWETVVKRKRWCRVVPAPKAEPKREPSGVEGKSGRRGKEMGKKNV